MTIKQVIAILESLKQEEVDTRTALGNAGSSPSPELPGNTGNAALYNQSAGYNIAVRSFNTDLELAIKQLKQ